MLEKNLNILLTASKKRHNIQYTQKYSEIPRNAQKYPEIPGYTQKYPKIPKNTRKYPRVKKIPENTRSYISTLLPDPNLTHYPVFSPIPDPTRYLKTLPVGHWFRVGCKFQILYKTGMIIRCQCDGAFGK